MDNSTSDKLLEHIIDLKQKQSATTEILASLRTELSEHREESKKTREEIEQAKGSIKVIKWVIGSGLVSFLYSLFKQQM